MTVILEIKDEGLEGLTVEVLDGSVEVKIPQPRSCEHMLDIIADLICLHDDAGRGSAWVIDLSSAHRIQFSFAAALAGLWKAVEAGGGTVEMKGCRASAFVPSDELELVHWFRNKVSL